MRTIFFIVLMLVSIALDAQENFISKKPIKIYDTTNNLYKTVLSETKGNQYLNCIADINFRNTTFGSTTVSAAVGDDNVFFLHTDTDSADIIATPAGFAPERDSVAVFYMKSTRTVGRVFQYQAQTNIPLSTGQAVSLKAKIKITGASTNNMRVYLYVRDQDGTTQNMGSHNQVVSDGSVVQFQVLNKTITKTNPVAIWVACWENDNTTNTTIYAGDFNVQVGATAVSSPVDSTFKIGTINNLMPDSTGNMQISSSSLTIDAASGDLGIDVNYNVQDSASFNTLSGATGVDTLSKLPYIKIDSSYHRIITSRDVAINNVFNHRLYSSDPPENNGTYVNIKDNSISYTVGQTDSIVLYTPPAGFSKEISNVLFADMGASRSASTVMRYTSTLKDAYFAPGDTISLHLEWKSTSSLTGTVSLYAKLDSVNNGSNISLMGTTGAKTLVGKGVVSFDIENKVIPASTEILYIFFYDDNTANRTHFIGNMTITKTKKSIKELPKYSHVGSLNNIRDVKDLTITAGTNTSVSTNKYTGEISISASSGSAVAENLLFDPKFEVAVDWVLPDTVQLIFWDRALAGTGSIVRLLNFESYGKSVLKIASGASGTTSAINQTVWFWNNENIFPDDSIHAFAWLNSGAIGGGKITLNFLDRTESVLSTANSSTVGTSWEKVVVSEAIPANCFGVQMSISVVGNNDSVYVALPMVATSLTSKWTDSKYDLRDYSYAQNLVRKLRRGSNVKIDWYGDSITRSGDTDAAVDGTSYGSYVKDWIDEKFGVTSVKRNYATDGSWEEKSLFLLDTLSIKNNADMIIFGDGRNRQSGTTTDYYGSDTLRIIWYEAAVRMIKNNSIGTDIVLFLPTPQKLGGTSGLTDNYYRDRKWRSQNKELASLYGTGMFNSYDKIISVANRGLVDWDLWFGTAGNTEVTHPSGLVWKRLIVDEFKKLIAGSMLYPNTSYQRTPGSFRIVPSSSAFDSTKFIAVSSPRVTEYGTWANDAQVTLSAGALTYSGGGVAAGNFDHPRVSTAANDSLVFEFDGTQLGIIFVTGSGRGTAEIHIDGSPYTVSTSAGSSAAEMFCRWRTWSESSPVTLSNARHHVKVFAQSASPISIVGFVTN